MTTCTWLCYQLYASACL